MKGFILAAGFGTRLDPLTRELPKALMPIVTVPAITYAVQLLAAAGITEIFVNLHHLGEQIKAALGDGSRLGMTITYSAETEILGTGGALRRVAGQLGGQRLVVVNADTLFDVDIAAAAAFHEDQGALATMVLRRDANQARYGLIEIDQAGRIGRFLGDPAPHLDDPGVSLRKFMFAGVHILEARFLEYIPPDIQTCINRYAYPKAMANDEMLCGYEATGVWRDLGTPASYFDANMEVLDRRLALPQLDPLSSFAHTPKREVDSVVRLGEGAILGDGVLLHPPVVIADGARIGDGAVIGPRAIIGRGAIVGKHANVSSVLVFDGARVEANATLSRCIVSRKHTVNVDEPHSKQLG